MDRRLSHARKLGLSRCPVLPGLLHYEVRPFLVFQFSDASVGIDTLAKVHDILTAIRTQVVLFRSHRIFIYQFKERLILVSSNSRANEKKFNPNQMTVGMLSIRCKYLPMKLSIVAKREKKKLLARHERQALKEAEKRRNILIANLLEQRILAEAFLAGERATIPKAYWATRADGSRVKRYKPKRVRNWFWVAKGGCYISLWYNSKIVQIGNGLDTINIGRRERLVDVIDELIGIVAEGDLDDEIEAVASKSIAAYKLYPSLRPNKLKLNSFLEKLENRN